MSPGKDLAVPRLQNIENVRKGLEYSRASPGSPGTWSSIYGYYATAGLWLATVVWRWRMPSSLIITRECYDKCMTEKIQGDSKIWK